MPPLFCETRLPELLGSENTKKPALNAGFFIWDGSSDYVCVLHAFYILQFLTPSLD